MLLQGIQELMKEFASHKAWLVFINVNVSRLSVVSEASVCVEWTLDFTILYYVLRDFHTISCNYYVL